MKFKSPNESEIHMALTSGHTFAIGQELVEVPRRFHKLAILAGAVPEGYVEPPPETAPPPNKMELIMQGIRAMVEDELESDFNGDGRPDVRKLSQRVGFTVLADERNTAWLAINTGE